MALGRRLGAAAAPPCCGRAIGPLRLTAGAGARRAAVRPVPAAQCHHGAPRRLFSAGAGPGQAAAAAAPKQGWRELYQLDAAVGRAALTVIIGGVLLSSTPDGTARCYAATIRGIRRLGLPYSVVSDEQLLRDHLLLMTEACFNCAAATPIFYLFFHVVTLPSPPFRVGNRDRLQYTAASKPNPAAVCVDPITDPQPRPNGVGRPFPNRDITHSPYGPRAVFRAGDRSAVFNSADYETTRPGKFTQAILTTA